jgi:hypothetical protein
MWHSPTPTGTATSPGGRTPTTSTSGRHQARAATMCLLRLANGRGGLPHVGARQRRIRRLPRRRSRHQRTALVERVRGAASCTHRASCLLVRRCAPTRRGAGRAARRRKHPRQPRLTEVGPDDLSECTGNRAVHPETVDDRHPVLGDRRLRCGLKWSAALTVDVESRSSSGFQSTSSVGGVGRSPSQPSGSGWSSTSCLPMRWTVRTGCDGAYRAGRSSSAVRRSSARRSAMETSRATSEGFSSQRSVASRSYGSS